MPYSDPEEYELVGRLLKGVWKNDGPQTIIKSDRVTPLLPFFFSAILSPGKLYMIFLKILNCKDCKTKGL